MLSQSCSTLAVACKCAHFVVALVHACAGASSSLRGKLVAVTGRAGCGKTALLHYLSLYAAKKNW